MLTNKKFGKYLLYAIGEVIILIAGIFFALQANNWNENRQNEVSEIVILKAIKTELDSDLTNLSIDVEVHKSQIISSQIIIDHLENNRPYNDSLSKHFLETCNYTITSINRGGYETLKSLGVGMISNIELRKQIVYLYDAQYAFLLDYGTDLKNNFLHGEKYILNSRFEEAENYAMELGENLEAVEYSGNMIPVDFEKLKSDGEYKYYLKTTKNKNKIYQGVLDDIKSMVSQVIYNIGAELNDLEK